MVYGDLQFFDIIIFAVIAVFLIYRLRGVLGKRTGYQKSPTSNQDTSKTSTPSKKNIPYETGDFPWAASGKALAIGANRGKTKIIFDPETKQVLGVGIVGPGAGDLISEGMLAIEMGADAEDIGLTIHPHPTLSETFAAAAEMFSGTITDLYIPKKKSY